MLDRIPLTPETEALARKIVWFDPPEKTCADPVRFAAYAFAYATHADMNILRRHMSEDDLKFALDRAPPGIIDARSWNYWHLRFGRDPAPPMPVRRFA